MSSGECAGHERSEDWRAHARAQALQPRRLGALRAVCDLDVRNCAMVPLGCAVVNPGAEGCGTGLCGKPAARHPGGHASIFAAASTRERDPSAADGDARGASSSGRLPLRSCSATSCPAVQALPPSHGTPRCIASLSSCRSLRKPSPWSSGAGSIASAPPAPENRHQHLPERRRHDCRSIRNCPSIGALRRWRCEQDCWRPRIGAEYRLSGTRLRSATTGFPKFISAERNCFPTACNRAAISQQVCHH